ELFLNRYMSHVRARCSTMPVLLPGREPDHITGMDLFDRSAFALHPAATSCHDQGLSERMRMPHRPRSRFECHAGTLHECRIRCLKEWVNEYRSAEPIGRTFDRGPCAN